MYLIKRKELNFDKQRRTHEKFLVGRNNNKISDVLNALDILLSPLDKREIQFQIMNKVFIYPEYQVRKIKLNSKKLCVYDYLIEFQDGKEKRLLIFNNLENLIN